MYGHWSTTQVESALPLAVLTIPSRFGMQPPTSVYKPWKVIGISWGPSLTVQMASNLSLEVMTNPWRFGMQLLESFCTASMAIQIMFGMLPIDQMGSRLHLPVLMPRWRFGMLRLGNASRPSRVIRMLWTQWHTIRWQVFWHPPVMIAPSNCGIQWIFRMKLFKHKSRKFLKNLVKASSWKLAKIRVEKPLIPHMRLLFRALILDLQGSTGSIPESSCVICYKAMATWADCVEKKHAAFGNVSRFSNLGFPKLAWWPMCRWLLGAGFEASALFDRNKCMAWCPSKKERFGWCLEHSWRLDN